MPRKAKQGVNITSYARSRGFSSPAIRKQIASGLLRHAVYPDGTLDEAAADALLNRGGDGSRISPGMARTPASPSGFQTATVDAHCLGK
jgi:hypothetical protein